MKKALGGERLGSGNKMNVDLKTFNRSTHDLSYIWRSTMACGTLVPFACEVLTPADTFDVELECSVLTKPTTGPLYGSYKVQLDCFEAPIRLYQGKLHQNKLGVGNEMQNVKLPLVRLRSRSPVGTKVMDNQQINPSSIFAYLGIRGLGQSFATYLERDFNAVPWLAYWDIYKNYYANKQEGIGAVLHTTRGTLNQSVNTIDIGFSQEESKLLTYYPDRTSIPLVSGMQAFVTYTGTAPNPDEIFIYVGEPNYYGGDWENFRAVPISSQWKTWTAVDGIMYGSTYVGSSNEAAGWRYITETDTKDVTPDVVTFPLEGIDNMRETLLQNVKSPSAVVIGWEGAFNNLPYDYALQQTELGASMIQSQEGLGLKTYQSDIFNNWLKTEWIGGANGVSAVTAIDTTSGKFTIDTLSIKTKVYNMLNAIAVSGGSYDDWINAAYDHQAYRKCESPMYHGGLIKEIIFDEVVSTAASTGEGATPQPLGQLAGRGKLSNKHKGGSVTIKADEHGYFMGIVSITPRIDYSQGNRWDVNLKTMDDFHKPYLDGIGFQDLITDKMAWWDTLVNMPDRTLTLRSAGKQPAWLDYQTNYNRTYGNFAIEDSEMFMTLNRRYERNPVTNTIADLTTYIDPAKFNNIFADESRDAQNFWVQIGVNITARRKMSAKLMPNL